MKWKITFIVIWVFGVAARASFFTDQDSDKAVLAREHVFMVDKEGFSIDPAKRPSRFSFDTPRQAEEARACAISNLVRIGDGIRKWSAQPKTLGLAAAGLPPRVVVFVHGGLNKYKDTYDRIDNPNLMGSLRDSNCYPIFVAWNSGPLSAIGQHLWSIRQGERADSVTKYFSGPASSPFMLISDIATGVARLPKTLTGQIVSDLATTESPRNFPWASRVVRWENFEEDISHNTNTCCHYRPPAQEGTSRGWGERTIRFSEYVVMLPIKIITLPLVDGLGTEAWDIMLRRTQTMFDPPGSYELSKNLEKWHGETNQVSMNAWLEHGHVGGMSYLAAALERWSTNRAKNFPTFEFYGHSMGAIVLNRLFRSEYEINATRIVYLGAACSIADFESSLFPYLHTHTNTSFYSLSLHRMRERDEYGLYSAGLTFPFVRDIVVRGSLLNWIDGIFAKPNTIAERTLGSWENITRAIPDVPNELAGRVNFRCSDLESLPILCRLNGLNEPQVHHDFTRAIFWTTNFYWPEGSNRLRLLDSKTSRFDQPGRQSEMVSGN